MTHIDKKDLYQWCKVHYSDLENHPHLRVRFRICNDSGQMGTIMARELVDEIQSHNQKNEITRAIIPCGPNCWYEPFTQLVNRERVSLHNLIVFHMDECLDWQGQELPRKHPFSFRGTMERVFYGPIADDLNVLPENRVWLNASNIESVRQRIAESPADIVYGGWGQDGHVAYNQARRNHYSQLSIAELRNSTIRIQENNPDTILALAQRSLGTAYQFVPPMSVTLGMREILAAKKIRVFSDTGAWKQTALRIALFSALTVEYPMTLLQEHPDALLTATVDTARHPISEHPEWDLGCL
jgi:glucosamine-6-phosphate deaminase